MLHQDKMITDSQNVNKTTKGVTSTYTSTLPLKLGSNFQEIWLIYRASITQSHPYKLPVSEKNQLTNRMCFKPYSDFQSRFNVLTHISPLLATFG